MTTARLLQPTTGRLPYGQGVLRASWTYERLRYGAGRTSSCLYPRTTTARLQDNRNNYSTTTARLRDDYRTTTTDYKTTIARSERVRGRLATSDDYVNTARSGRASSLPGPTDDYHTVSWTPDDYGTARACSGPARRLPHSQLDPGRLRHGQGVL